MKPSDIQISNPGACHSAGYETPSPLFNDGTGVELGLFVLGNTPSAASRGNTPASMSGPTTPGTPNEPNDHSSSLSPASTFDALHLQLTQTTQPGCSIHDICKQHGISDHTIGGAKYAKSKGEDGSLLAMVLNQRCMAQVLIQLGYQSNLHDPCQPSKNLTFTGQEYTALDVIKYFGWTFKSYQRKCGWFGWAEEAARTQEWSGPAPTESKS
jgi:hypothetical protein